MKRPLLMSAVLALGFSAGAEITGPESFSSHFGESGVIPADWIMYGVDAAPSGQFASYFQDYSSTSSFTVLQASTSSGTLQAACTPQQFADGSRTDQWLITPEFEIEKDAELLSFSVLAGGNNTKNYYSVYLSEAGADKEDFKENQLLSTALQGKMGDINTTSRRIVLEGYAGKKVRLAFVSDDNMGGIMGFSDVNVAPYYLSVENPESLESVVLDSSNPLLTFRIKVSTPEKVSGLTAVLKCSNGYESTYEYSGTLTPNMFTTVIPIFSGIDFMGEGQVDYTISITPNGMEGVEPTIVSGTLMNASRIYNPVLLAEEPTGTWCGNCPYGTAYMNYYSDLYDGLDGAPRFIPIAIHDNDPMQVPADYINGAQTTALKYMAQFGYPTVILNRATAEHPLYIPVIKYADIKAFASLYISRVDYDEVARRLTVNYNPRVSFSASSSNIRAAVVVLENGVTGVGDSWSQANYIYNATKQQVAEQLGEAIVPYLEPFIEQTSQYVPASKMVYNDVARGIFPSYDGQLLEGEWKADTYREEQMTVSVPTSVSNTDNMAVVVMLLNGGSGEIIAADILEAEDFGKDFSGVAPVLAKESGVTLYAADAVAVVESEAPGVVRVFAADGQLLHTCDIPAGHSEVPLSSGLNIVKVDTPTGSATLKALCK